MKSFTDHVRPKLKPACNFLLVCKSVIQLANLGDVFGRMVSTKLSARTSTRRGTGKSSKRRERRSQRTTVRSPLKEATEVVATGDASKTKRKKKCAFTKDEDQFLLRGLNRYGKGKWTSILKEPEYKFHPSRQNSTLMTRV